MMPLDIPVSLYIHIPWCLKKCPYCDFNSHQHKEKITEEMETNYINALLLDLNHTLNLYYPQTIDKQINKVKINSIFIGGGTPNLFSALSIGNLLDNLNKILTISPNCEITLEANPGAFEEKKFRDFKNIGINRLSIGVQSFNDQSLKNIGRIHNQHAAINAITTAKDLDFNLNIDLMHGLPGQDFKTALLDLKTAIQFEPNHISWYQLTIEPNTEFAKKPPKLPDEKILDNIYLSGMEFLKNNNYLRYEISAFAKKTDYQSQHNLNYWKFGDYIGIGAGAHSKITKINFAENNSKFEIIRLWKQKSPVRYLDHNINKISGENKLTLKDIILEYMMNRLRLMQPILEEEFSFYTNLNFSDLNQEIINKAIKYNWLIKDQNYLTVTDLGHKFLNNLVLLFV